MHRQKHVMTSRAGKRVDERSVVELPVFPMNSVALPLSRIPINLIEKRHLMLFHTLCKGVRGAEPGEGDEPAQLVGAASHGVSLRQRGKRELPLCVLDFVRKR